MGREQAVLRAEDERFQLVAEAARTGQVAGAVGSYRTDPGAGWFEHGVMIGADRRRSSCAAGATTLSLRHMFEERRHHHRCQARALAHSEPSLALQRRLMGCVRRGVRPETGPGQRVRRGRPVADHHQFESRRPSMARRLSREQAAQK
ncbi:GNAT family N-acetyltransferase [Streptomyces murinus]|uniref:GNAT family N-acetyltransferase n=1 Tax=Streptomyces murinus TaxID=33900 RepID=UPI0021147DB7|nr:hypothetical protein [Streptomyces murinus]